MTAKKKKAADPNSQTVCRNRRARHDYEIVDELECGIVLAGSEVKSIRDGKMTIDEAFARVERNELWLFNADIGIYPQATYLNHERQRPRKLLLKKSELRKFAETAMQSGMTLIPLSVYFSRGLVKVQIGSARGRKEYDKRQKIKKNDADRTLRDAVRKRV
ncbi:SsrA-binding protein SmpB [Planctomicrobium sp. SH664]|uniref:SsrA-binding protein SmpB n=1 Tax=Planctomicrobium sp. SH664 TaxID=3448125 RepID=UPI003F5BCC39